MPLTSIWFIVTILFLMVIYYQLSEKLQWIFLLCISCTFYLWYAGIFAMLVLLTEALLVYLGAIRVSKISEKKKKICVMSVLTGCIIILSFFCYRNFIIRNGNRLLNFLHIYIPDHTLQILTPLGISFFSMSLIAYFMDVCWEIEKAEKNFAKVLLFGAFFPVVTTGPILRYGEAKKQFFIKHSFSYETFTYGLQRIVWGSFKCLVIAARLNIITETVFNHYQDYSGMILLFAAGVAVVNLYLNFSGSIDVVLGIAELFGIILPENFDHPFLAETSSEFWRKWHITLGVWFKDYIFYPVMKSDFIQKISTKSKKYWGKKVGKKVATYSALFILWTITGIWHGGAWKYIVGVGWFYWFYILEEDLLRPKIEILFSKMGISKESGIMIFLRRAMTMLKFLTVMIFFFAPSFTSGLLIYQRIFTQFGMNTFAIYQLLELGIDKWDYLVVAGAYAIFLLASHMSKKSDIRKIVAKKNIIARWVIYYAILFILLIYGCYGAGFDTSGFIYQQF